MKNGSSRFTPSEIVTLIYASLTGLLVCFYWSKPDNPMELLLFRIAVIATIFGISELSKRFRFTNKLMWFIRNIGPLTLVGYWYPETYQLGKCLLPNLDHIFIAADQWLFRCQPSMEFSKFIPYGWFNELMNFGYFTYFIMIAGTAFYFFFKDLPLAQKTSFIILCSFLFYYAIFIVLPVEGPQFHFQYPDNKIPDAGFFRELIKFVQETGEQPTGAFPSSHVGICLINLALLYKYARKGFYMLLPIAILLVCSTVYIKAHYLIDVIAGFITAPFIYWLSQICWRKFEKNNSFIERVS